MKRNLYILAAGLLVSSCIEPSDVVTGRARVVFKNQPVAAPAPVAATPSAPKALPPAPKPVVEAPVIEKPIAKKIVEAKPEVIKPDSSSLYVIEMPNQPAPESSETTGSKTFFSQTQPAAVETPAAPAEPKKEQSVIKNQPVTATPATEKKAEEEPAPFFSQNQNAPTITTSPAGIAPVPAPTPTTSTQPRTVSPSVAQQQPSTTSPTASQYRTPQSTLPTKRTYPIMPGQNRGLRNRSSF